MPLNIERKLNYKNGEPVDNQTYFYQCIYLLLFIYIHLIDLLRERFDPFLIGIELTACKIHLEK